MDRMTRDEYLTAWRAKHGVTYSADFVPFSKSRNAKPFQECKLTDLSINWRVTLTRGGRAFTTDYQQGTGYLPERVRVPWKGANFSRMVIGHWPIVVAAVERGEIVTENGLKLPGGLISPTFEDVAECLVLDAGVLDYVTFEDWACEYGYEQDSRAAEKIYNECRRIALDLRAVLGAQAFEEFLKMPMD